MPDIDIQSQSQSVRFFHYLEAIAATFLLFALLVMDRLTNKADLSVLR